MRYPTRALPAIVAGALALLATGCGGTGTSVAHGGGRTVDMTMTDNAFTPTELRVGAGETVTFVFRNDGSVEHEAILGDDAAQMAHHGAMTATSAPMEHGDMGHEGDSTDASGAISVAPGRTGELTHTFSESGTVLIGCHEPGHWEAGMKATVTIG